MTPIDPRRIDPGQLDALWSTAVLALAGYLALAGIVLAVVVSGLRRAAHRQRFRRVHDLPRPVATGGGQNQGHDPSPP